MTTTCPKCQSPLREGARFCGFCGADLLAPAEVAPALASEKETRKGKKKVKKLAKQKRGVSGKTITTVAIVLLVLVIAVAVAIQYWWAIVPWVSQILP